MSLKYSVVNDDKASTGAKRGNKGIAKEGKM